MNNLKFFMLSCFLITLTVFGQSEYTKKVDEGEINGNIYNSKEIGWTFEIPQGWDIMDVSMSEKMNQKGLKVLESTIDAEIDTSQLKHLISIKHGRFNILQSSSEPFGSNNQKEWLENNEEIKKILLQTFDSQGIKNSYTPTTVEKIDGKDFQHYKISLYYPNGNLLMEQLIFSRLINGFDFSVHISCADPNDQKVALQALKNSKFKK